MEAFDLWIREAVNLSLAQTTLLIVLCLFLVLAAMSIDYIDDGKEGD